MPRRIVVVMTGLAGKSDYEFMDPLNRPITAIAHSTLHVSSSSGHHAARHSLDETAVIVGSIQVVVVVVAV